jgi:hypothetical protein
MTLLWTLLGFAVLVLVYKVLDTLHWIQASKEARILMQNQVSRFEPKQDRSKQD